MASLEKSLRIDQITAIRSGVAIGLRIQREIPQFIEDYRKGITRQEIAKKYDLYEWHHLGHICPDIIESGISRALYGNTNSFLGPVYKGIVSRKEARKLTKKHKELSGKVQRDQKKGIHAQSREQLRQLGLKTGPALGDRMYKERKGIHALSHQELSKAGKKGVRTIQAQKRGWYGLTQEQRSKYGREGALLSGGVPFDEGERLFAIGLTTYQAFRYRSRQLRTELIAKTLNEYWHNGKEVRSRDTMGQFYYKEKKRLKIKHF